MALIQAVREQDFEKVKALLRDGHDARFRDSDGYTALHLAAHHNNRRIVRSLIASGADVNAQDDEGDTPLHSAACNGASDSIAELLMRGADGAVQNIFFGRTPKQWAETFGKLAQYEAAEEAEAELAQIAVAGTAAKKALLADVTAKNPDASYIELLRRFKEGVRALRLEVLVTVMLARERRTPARSLQRRSPRLLRGRASDSCMELAGALATLPSGLLEMVADAVAALGHADA